MDKNSIKVITDDKQTTADEIKELEEKLILMKEDKDKKCKAAKKQLIEMLEVTADKYRTATGTAEALRVLRFAMGKESFADDITIANDLAYQMAAVTMQMKEKAEKLPYVEMDTLCDGFYQKDFELTSSDDDDDGVLYHVFDLTFEMMKIDLCRNVGSAAEDMVSFVQRSQEEIDATGKRLKELKNS